MAVQVSVKALIENKGRYLVLKQKVKNKVIFTLPGGRLNFRENITEGVKREVKEETNLSIEAIEPIGVWGFQEESLDSKQYVACITFLCRLKGKPNLKLAKKDGSSIISSAKWLPKKDLKKLKVEQSLKRVFSDFCNKYK